MIDLFNSLTWQFQILFFEGFASLLVGIWLFQGAPFLRTPEYMVLSLGWDATALTLFLSGGATTSWQHVAYLSVFCISITGACYGFLNKKVVEKPKHEGATYFVVALFALLMTILLVSGR